MLSILVSWEREGGNLNLGSAGAGELTIAPARYTLALRAVELLSHSGFWKWKRKSWSLGIVGYRLGVMS